ncbi:hypothetical protein A3715_11980 [Oleiphilus sp. HI0009]|nr:hypothetical protein A3715_11980 [Oleiphilus sp. HI0009]
MNNYEAFDAVVTHGSFTKAAKQLHRSPSAISKLIAQLEEQLGIQLFDRTTRCLNLTEAGKLYSERCKEIVQKMDEAETELREFSGEAVGKIRITFPNALSSSPIIPVLSEFTARYPKVSFDSNASIEKKNLTEDDYDFAFRLGTLEDSGMIGIKLFDIEPAFAASQALVEQYGKPKHISDLTNYPLLIPNNIPIKKLLTHEDSPIPHPTNLVHTGVDIATFLNLASSGFAASFCFQHMLKPFIEKGSLIDTTPPDVASKIPVYLIYKNYQYMPVKHRCFIDLFKSAFIDSPSY